MSVDRLTCNPVKRCPTLTGFYCVIGAGGWSSGRTSRFGTSCLLSNEINVPLNALHIGGQSVLIIDQHSCSDLCYCSSSSDLCPDRIFRCLISATLRLKSAMIRSLLLDHSIGLCSDHGFDHGFQAILLRSLLCTPRSWFRSRIRSRLQSRLVLCYD